MYFYFQITGKLIKIVNNAYFTQTETGGSTSNEMGGSACTEMRGSICDEICKIIYINK